MPLIENNLCLRIEMKGKRRSLIRCQLTNNAAKLLLRFLIRLPVNRLVISSGIAPHKERETRDHSVFHVTGLPHKVTQHPWLEAAKHASAHNRMHCTASDAVYAV